MSSQTLQGYAFSYPVHVPQIISRYKIACTFRCDSTDSMNNGDATYADAPKHPRIDRPINPVAKMICQGGIKPWATSCRNLGEHRGLPGQLHRDPQRIQ